MKAKVIRDDLEASLPHVRDDEKAMLEARQVQRNGRQTVAFFWKVGSIIDRPDAHRLVGLGYAKPADDQCAERTKQWTDNWEAVERGRARLAAAIHPEDFHLFDAGYIAGYLPNGDYKPGPKWSEYQSILTAQAADEEDDDE